MIWHWHQFSCVAISQLSLQTFYNYNFLNIYENKLSKKDQAVYAICIQSEDIKIYVTSIWFYNDLGVTASILPKSRSNCGLAEIKFSFRKKDDQQKHLA